MAAGSFKVTLMSGINYTLNTYTTSDTWNKPANLDYVIAIIVSGGGGGKSGRRGAASTLRAGGGAGNGGALVMKIKSADLGSTATVTVGAGGIGTAGRTTDTTSGANGTTGGTSSFNVSNSITGGTGNVGGATASVARTATTVTYTMTTSPRMFVTGVFANSCLGITAVADADRSFLQDGAFNIMPSSSCGAQITAANAQTNAGTLGGFINSGGTLTEEITGTLPQTNGVQPTQSVTFGEWINTMFDWFDPADAPELIGRGGLGGGCGDLAGTIAAGNGANGIGYGAAGGGGGASTNGANSGAGGNGTQGIVYVINVLKA